MFFFTYFFKFHSLATVKKGCFFSVFAFDLIDSNNSFSRDKDKAVVKKDQYISRIGLPFILDPDSFLSRLQK